ncbi:outer membrane protein OmpX [Pantoea sp. Nvir]|uniref:outer membrane protein OmpX n=1 Tax=Pantoea sp. Nvir TaxID=2576760 RepID=UPI00135BA8D7|nr:outer membrane protein OmpX [Pantoea sp. Nvir]MXP66305.1 outer membrane protein OmpX [Pantoea sp. Nvir]CAJ0992896.1 Outer membrane protein X [Pantoea sp. Nvir]
MKKIACLSALACILSSSAMAQSTITGGFAQSDYHGMANRANGLNLKYRYEGNLEPFGWSNSFTFTERGKSASHYYHKNQYYSLTTGPVYRFNDWVSIYGVVGGGYGKFQKERMTYRSRHKFSNSDLGFSYGAGLQFNPVQNLAIDLGYEQSRIRNIDVSTWMAGIGYRF